MFKTYVRPGGAMIGILALLLSALTGCGGDPIAESVYSPPTEGIGEVVGTVTRADGQPAVNAEILVTRCQAFGYMGRSKADSDGAFSVRTQLPPYIGLTEETERVTCIAAARYPPATSIASTAVDVVFTPPEVPTVPVRVELVEGDTVPRP